MGNDPFTSGQHVAMAAAAYHTQQAREMQEHAARSQAAAQAAYARINGTCTAAWMQSNGTEIIWGPAAAKSDNDKFGAKFDSKADRDMYLSVVEYIIKNGKDPRLSYRSQLDVVCVGVSNEVMFAEIDKKARFIMELLKNKLIAGSD